MDTLKAILHVNDMERWDITLAYAKSLLDLGYDADIIILVNGEAVRGLLKEESFEEDVGFLLGTDIEVHACSNSIDLLKLNKEELIDNFETVPSGVAALIEKQNEGYRYIKP